MTLGKRLVRFLRMPWGEKVIAVRHKVRRSWLRIFPDSTYAVRLPYGGWWLAQNDTCSEEIAMGNFEVPEFRFVNQFLQEGMTVLDIGAHCGFYSMLASRRVGGTGRVIAFEPSPRERGRLEQHLRRNGCINVQIEPAALSNEEGERELFLVKGPATGCNSLKPPADNLSTIKVRVQATTLDGYLRRHEIERVDFIKLDVEGGERDVLRGATSLFGKPQRPIILCEVDDTRTKPWGYRSCEILSMLSALGYEWFGLTNSGDLTSLDESQSYNFIAAPVEHPFLTNRTGQHGFQKQKNEHVSLHGTETNQSKQE